MTNGIFSIEDLLQVKNASVVTFGIDKINATYQADLDYFNGQLDEQLGDLVYKTTEHTLLFGGAAERLGFSEVDEMGSAVSAKVKGGASVNVPLKRFESAVGWDASYLQLATPAEMTTAYLAVRSAYAESVSSEISKAMFIKDNFNTKDELATGLSLSVKRLLNADGMVIPSYRSNSFNKATHTHYLVQADTTLASSDVTGLINHVAEHGGKSLKIYVNYADASKLSALSGFVGLASSVIVYNNSDVSRFVNDPEADPYNKLIGHFAEIPVYTRSWVPAGYVLCFASDVNEKVLAMRVRPQAALQGLRIDSKFINAPLQADNFRSEYGFGAYGRQNAAILYLSNTAYVNPTF